MVTWLAPGDKSALCSRRLPCTCAFTASTAAAAGSNTSLPGTTYSFTCMLFQDMISDLTAPNGARLASYCKHTHLQPACMATIHRVVVLPWCRQLHPGQRWHHHQQRAGGGGDHM